MHEYLELIGRTVLAFIALLLISRILGKQTISNMTFHDFATGITMGAIAANLAFYRKFHVLYFLICLVVLTLTSYISSVVALKYPRSRHWIAGAPTVVIDKGNLLEGNMRKIHYTLDSLNQSLREKDIFNLDEVDYAILETN
ncbi:MAG TPA: YetF domain-containing protein, partial [Paenibacillus sp.]